MEVDHGPIYSGGAGSPPVPVGCGGDGHGNGGVVPDPVLGFGLVHVVNEDDSDISGDHDTDYPNSADDLDSSDAAEEPAVFNCLA